MLIGGLHEITFIDYPGKLSCTVFCLGCSFKCPFCYASELVLPEKIKFQPRIPEKNFFNFLKNRKELLEGVVICGGEPTINEDLPKFIKKIKGLGFLVKLDTNGSNPEMLEDLIKKKIIDYAAMDIKAPKDQYGLIVGMNDSWNAGKIDNVQKSIDILKEGNVDYEFRSTIVPSLHTKDDVIEMAKWIRGAKKYYLQNFKPSKTINPEFENIKPYPDEYLLEIQKAIAPLFDVCQVRGC